MVTVWIALSGKDTTQQPNDHELPELWSAPIRHNLWGRPLHSIIVMVVFFPVPPSMRQAAGPLTENLPYVCLSDRKPVDLSLESPSPRGTKRRLSARILTTAPALHARFEVDLHSFERLEMQSGLEASAKPSAAYAAANRLTTKRGHLA